MNNFIGSDGNSYELTFVEPLRMILNEPDGNEETQWIQGDPLKQYRSASDIDIFIDGKKLNHWIGEFTFVKETGKISFPRNYPEGTEIQISSKVVFVKQ